MRKLCWSYFVDQLLSALIFERTFHLNSKNSSPSFLILKPNYSCLSIVDMSKNFQHLDNGKQHFFKLNFYSSIFVQVYRTSHTKFRYNVILVLYQFVIHRKSLELTESKISKTKWQVAVVLDSINRKLRAWRDERDSKHNMSTKYLMK